MRIDKNHWLLTNPIAHRGLWNEKMPENTILAYENAIKHGFPIEIDLQKSCDGEIFVYHDDDLLRLANVNAKICHKNKDYIKSLNILDTNEKIPTLTEVLETVNGRVPLLIEIKNQPDKNIVKDTLKALKDYNGEYAIQSFNPLYLLQLKKLDKSVLRGVLGTKSNEPKGAIKKFIVNKMPLNFLIKPDFISYRINDLPIKTKKVPIISWTITDSLTKEKAERLSKNFIFENFIPKK